MPQKHNALSGSMSGMELLAPAGGFPAFEAALEAGADAVYVGAPGCNARALSRDFTFAEIGSMIRQAHGQGVRVYIAMNSLLKEAELPAALETLSRFEQLRPDALIIQDLGLLYLARTWFPDLPLHASTLMSVHNAIGAAELTRSGFERVVLARELTIEEIADIHRTTGTEIEVFIHGAMCFSYSGLCMFSSLHGGKSSLRGQCVQPCRRHYFWQQAEKQRNRGRSKKSGKSTRGSASYLFSMNDLCGIDLLPELRNAGVACLKIEGRLKNARYVGNTVAAYRMVLDSLDEPDAVQTDVLRQAHQLLDGAMGRKRAGGYLLTENPKQAISPDQSGNSGRLLGQVRGIRREGTKDGGTRLTIRLRLTAPVSEGDRLRLHDENSGERMSFTLRSLQVQGRRKKTKTGQAGEQVILSLLTKQNGTFNRHFQGSLFQVDVGTRIVAERSGRRRSRQLSGRRVVPDRKKVEGILGALSWKTPAANRQKKQGKKQPAERHGRGKGSKDLPWWVVLAKPSDLRQRLPVRAQRIILPLHRENVRQFEQMAGKIKKYHSRLIWRLPSILPETEVTWTKEQVRRLAETGCRRFALGHYSQFSLFSSLKNNKKGSLELFGHYTLNLLNSVSLEAARQAGLHGALFSLESEGENLAMALRHSSGGRGRAKGRNASARMQFGMYVYGYPPLFTSRLTAEHFRWQQPFISPKGERFILEQRDGLTLAEAEIPFSLLDRRQELAAMGVDFLLLDCSGGPMRQEVATVKALLGQGGGQRPGKGRRTDTLRGNFDGVLV